jgi:hypothetical protein
VSTTVVEVGGSVVVVVVGGRVVLVVVGGAVVVVERAGGGAVVVVSRRAGSRVEVTARTLRGMVVTDSAAAGARVGPGVLGEAAGAVSNPSTLPPLAPRITATVSVAQRRSKLYRTRAPVCAHTSMISGSGGVVPGLSPVRAERRTRGSGATPPRRASAASAGRIGAVNSTRPAGSAHVAPSG